MFRIDYRFIIDAKDLREAMEKLINFLPEATDDVWYTEKNKIVLLENPYLPKEYRERLEKSLKLINLVDRSHEIWDVEGHADWLEKVWGEPEKKRGRHWLLLRLIAKLVRYSPMVDAGCGMGHFFLTMKQHHPETEYLGFDNSGDMLNKAKKFFPEDADKFCVGDVYDLSDKKTYPSVVCVDVLIHLPEITGPIQQLWSRAEKELIFSVRPTKIKDNKPFLIRKPVSGRIKLPKGKKLIVRADKFVTIINAIGTLKDVGKIEMFKYDWRSTIFRLTRGIGVYNKQKQDWNYP